MTDNIYYIKRLLLYYQYCTKLTVKRIFSQLKVAMKGQLVGIVIEKRVLKSIIVVILGQLVAWWKVEFSFSLNGQT